MATGGREDDFESNAYEGYYLRLHLLVMKYGTSVLRARFNYSIAPSKLRQTLQQSIGIIKQAKNKQIITEDQYNLVCSQCIPLTSEELDVSLLIFLLKNVCGLDRRSKWWGEEDNGKIPTIDISEEADIVRIRNIKNETQHAKVASLYQTVFENKWDIIEQAMLRLGTTSGMQSLSRDITTIRKESLEIVKEQITYFSQYSEYDNDRNGVLQDEQESSKDEKHESVAFIDGQDDHDHEDIFQDQCDFFNDGQYKVDCMDELHHEYGVFVDLHNDDDGDNEKQDDYDAFIFWQDDFDRYEELRDKYEALIDRKADYNNYGELRDGYDIVLSGQYYHKHSYELQDEYEDFVDRQSHYDRVDELENYYNVCFEEQDAYDCDDESQDDYDLYIDEQDEYDDDDDDDEFQGDYDVFAEEQHNFNNDDELQVDDDAFIDCQHDNECGDKLQDENNDIHNDELQDFHEDYVYELDEYDFYGGWKDHYDSLIDEKDSYGSYNDVQDDYDSYYFDMSDGSSDEYDTY